MTDHIDMVTEFTNLINTSQGKIFFTTAEGDRLVADSMLSALVGFATILNAAKTIPLTYTCENEDDSLKLEEFLRRYDLLCQPAN